MRKFVLVCIALVGIVVLSLFFYKKTPDHTMTLRTYFKDAKGMRPGAEVRIAGVDVGSVVSVRARPELPQNPAEIVMNINTNDQLAVPSDAVTSVQTAGILGESYVDIDVSRATGPPATNNSMLKSEESKSPSMAEIPERAEQNHSGKSSVGNDLPAKSK